MFSEGIERDSTIKSDKTFFRGTAELHRFFLGKFLELLAINLSLSERRDIFIFGPRLLKLSHGLVVLQFPCVRTSLQLSWITQFSLTPYLECQGSCDIAPNGPAGSVLSLNICQGLKF